MPAELELLTEEEIRFEEYRPEALPFWWPDDWIQAFWISKFGPAGVPPRLSLKAEEKLEENFPQGWTLCFRPPAPIKGKAKRKISFEKGASWCIIPAPPHDKHKFRVKELLYVEQGIVSSATAEGSKIENLDIQVIDGNWSPVSADTIPGSPIKATILPQYELKAVWYRNYNAFFSHYMPQKALLLQPALFRHPKIL